jgi:hypothetical protein
MKKQLYAFLLFACSISGSERQLCKQKTKILAPTFSCKPEKGIFNPLPIKNLHKLIQADSHIGSYIDQYQRSNQQYFVEQKNLTSHELARSTNVDDKKKLAQRLKVMNTMLGQIKKKDDEPDWHATIASPIYINVGDTRKKKDNSDEPGCFLTCSPTQNNNIDSTTSNTPTHAETTIHRSRQIVSQNRNTNHLPSNNAKAMKPLFDKKGPHLVINGEKHYISEGQHVIIANGYWVLIGKNLIKPGIGEAIIDHKGNCHFCDSNGKLHKLINGKNNWVTLPNNDIYIFHEGKFLYLPVNDTITLHQQQFINQNGALRSFSSDESIQKKVASNNVISCLYSTKNNGELQSHLNDQIQNTLINANAKGYVVPELVEWQLQSSLNLLSNIENPKEFAFHLATIEHLSHDITIQAAHAAKSDIPIIERSSKLFAQAITSYLNYLSPTENEISLIIDCARYISDVTIGTEYLSTEVCNQRINQFWQTINNINWQQVSQITAEQVIDSVAYIAARATYALGVPEAVSVIKNVFDAVEKASYFAQRYIKQFDQVLQDNPIIITQEGTVIANASKEAVAQTTHIIQAFDGMKDKESKKSPPEILDSAKKVMESEKLANNKYSNLTPAEQHLIKESTKDIISQLKKGKGTLIKDVYKDLMNSFNHMFQKNHITQELLQLGAKEEICRNVLNKIYELDLENKLQSCGNQIEFIINNIKYTIRCTIIENQLKSIDLFANGSNRIIGNLINLGKIKNL